mmetsp:Transcript_40443/g.126537  ORF Transcript_40443/g.126537 Transcript_40443/m.126537 type:complete len:460 (-) Transcript_40443:211-1590(-)
MQPLHPLDGRDWAGLTLAIFGLMIAAGGGIGGGGVLVPLYILVLGFHPKFAIPLSNITIFGGAITNTILNAPKRHPLADRPLVDWDLILVMEPLTIVGALVGSFMNKVLPEWILTVLLVILLGATSHRTMKKGLKVYKKETETQKTAMEEVLREQEESEERRESRSLLAHEDEDDEDEDAAAEGGDGDGKGDEEAGGAKGAKEAPTRSDSSNIDIRVESYTLRDILDEEAKTPWDKVFKLAAVFLVIIVINLAKGGGGWSPLGVQCGSFEFWFLTAAMLGVLGYVSWEVRKYLVHRTSIKQQLLYHYVEGDVVWDERATITYPVICALAGFAAGMFGVGGGIVKGPLMLEMGVHPAVASATSACMILYTSFTATTSFVAFGMVKFDYAIFLFFVGLIATAVGQLGVNYLIKKYKRQSLIILSIGSVVTLSTIMMGGQSLYHIAFGDEESGDNNICHAGE